MTVTIKETIHPNLAISLYSNFRNSTEAIFELIDNAVSDRIPGRCLEVEITNGTKWFTITNRNGYGMGIDELTQFFNWGVPKDRRKDDIGHYSQGGKAALGYLGSGWQIISSKDGEDVEWSLKESNWGKRTAGFKSYTPTEKKVSYKEGIVTVSAKKNKGKIRIREDKLIKEIGDTYRTLIERGDVVFTFNGDIVKPEQFPLDNNFKKELIDFTIDGWKVSGWVGRSAEKSGISGGIRCYSKGRLVPPSEYFGHPDSKHKHSLNYLIGEVHIDFVPLNMNKTGFIRDSALWRRVEAQMFEILSPHIKDLLAKKVTDEPIQSDHDAVQTAKDILNAFEKEEQKGEQKTGPLSGLYEPAKEGEVGEEDLIDKLRKMLPQEKVEKKQPTSPPSPRPKKRKPIFNGMDIKVVKLPEYLRSSLIVEKGVKTIQINNVYPAYKAFKGNLPAYILESAYIHIIQDKEENLNAEEFLLVFEERLRKVCAFMQKNKQLKKSLNTIIKQQHNEIS